MIKLVTEFFIPFQAYKDGELVTMNTSMQQARTFIDFLTKIKISQLSHHKPILRNILNSAAY